MKISIFGIGYVGTVSGACLASFGHDVIGVDLAPEKVALLKRGRSPVVEPGLEELIAAAAANGKLDATTDAAAAVRDTDISFISVGTPGGPDGKLSLAAVEAVIAEIGRTIREKALSHTVVMRSTVPPGSAESRLIPLLESASGRRQGDGVLYYANPEFMREGTAVRDFSAPPFTVIGAPAGDAATLLTELYAPVNAPMRICPYRVAESVKYLSNIYHAVKLAFANEAGAILAAHQVDAREAFGLFCEDRLLNISPAYLRPGFAFGGSCLPKDIRSFLALADDRQIAAPFLKQLLASNQSIIERTYEAIARHGRQRVSLFGLAFKPGTDDLRESPFVLLAERLIGKGFELRIFDRSVELARLMGTNLRYIDREIPHLGRLLARSPAEALAGSRIAVVGHIGEADLPALLDALSDETVLDLAGIPQLKRCKGIAYQGLCW
jgi:GDP-mannose 6-dehydrogenase